MTTDAKLLFLGTGGSMGIPVIACHCPVCDSKNQKNIRSRSSALLKIKNRKILLDCGPDFRAQALSYGIDHLDGVVLTHAHHDHTGGIDELRAYYVQSRRTLPCLLSRQTANEIKLRYEYIFRERKVQESLVSQISLQILEEKRGIVDFLGIPFKYMTYEQGGMEVNGFRIGDFAYISDIRHYPSSIFEDLKGVKTLVISALRHLPSDLHFNVDEAVQFSQRICAEETWLTHIAHDLDHDETNTYLPSNIKMAYDGLEIQIPLEKS